MNLFWIFFFNLGSLKQGIFQTQHNAGDFVTLMQPYLTPIIQPRESLPSRTPLPRETVVALRHPGEDKACELSVP